MSWPERLAGRLPPWRRLRVLLSPEGMAWRDAGIAGLPWTSASYGFTAAGAPATPAAPAWRPPLEALGQLLARLPGRRSLEVLLGGAFVRWQLLPARPALVAPKERQAYAEHRCREIYGDVAGEWSVVVADMPADEPLVVAAIDRALVAGLRALADQGRHRLDGVGPAFACAFDRLRGRLGGRCHLFALVEPGRLTCARFADGRWLALRGGVRVEGEGEAGWQEALAGLARDTGLATVESVAAAGPPPEAFYLCGVDAAPATLAGLPVRHLALPADWP